MTSPLSQLSDLLESLDINTYRQSIPELPHGGVGGHVRHALEFFQCFFAGLKEGKIDYSSRERNLEIETQPQTALECCAAIIGRLEMMSECSEQAVQVRSESHSEGPWLDSSVARELDYLAQHLVHHMALMAVILRRLGHDVPQNFGVAQSTLSFWKTQSPCAP